MAPKIFITGATGYIGGNTLHALYSRYPDYEYAALVRTEQKGETVKKAFPDIRLVIGDNDSSKTIEVEASKADIVIHTADASDHEGAARAIAKGLASGHSKEHPGFWLHTGGTGILCWEDMNYDRLGEHSDHEYNDWTKVDELTHLPDEAFHRNVDKIVLQAGLVDGDKVKTALLCPPTIYGRGKGPASTRSRQAYELAKFILTHKYIPIIGNGKARWNNIHVEDLSRLFVLFTEAAVSKNLDPELWGEKGYYFVEHGEHVWADIARQMGERAEKLGYIGKLEEKALSKDKAIEQAGFEAVSWGLNSRGKGERARRLLGWKAMEKSLEEILEEILIDEKERLR